LDRTPLKEAVFRPPYIFKEKFVFKKIKNLIILIVVLGVVAIFTLFSLYFYNIYSASDSAGEDLKFTVKKGQGVKEIGRNLLEKDLIDSTFWFETYVWLYEKEKSFQAGQYILNTSMSLKEIVIILTSGQTIDREKKITIIEGWNLRNIANYLEEQSIASKKDFFALAGEPLINYHKKTVDPEAFPKDYSSRFSFLESKPKYYSLEGYLFPDTYKIFKGAEAEQVILKMLNNFDRKLSRDLRKEIEKQSKTIHEIVTMASLLEKEVRTLKDMKIVSGIFWDRIEQGQPLQSCATLAYILKKNKLRYSTEDTKVDSPFNTYQNKGLPPSPICNPGLKAIKAAIYPQESDYNYFLSRSDNGETVFSRTLSEHQKNQQKYLK